MSTVVEKDRLSASQWQEVKRWRHEVRAGKRPRHAELKATKTKQGDERCLTN